ncbi:hypothetical protein JMJ56_15765 [Belnapia sp. T18]|uniref:Uncharacterized protein n=1 Tax=Belnapia arida TaxID=2804533 RepID=A0ABS1U6Z8_9PROT|nr:hypothetical protein [Belnapia arida]MBL6079477.1 hypothetical protein [Belnapia arida]
MPSLQTSRAPSHLTETREQPFRSVEEVWFWTMAALTARRDGARIVSGAGLVSRPCEPDDVIRCLDRLYRQRRIELAHARIMRIWGERGEAPNPRSPREAGDWRLWTEAMRRLDWPLRVKGIITGPLPVNKPADILDFPGAGS